MAGACNNPSCDLDAGKEQHECIICSNPLHNLCSFPKGVSEDDQRLCFVCFSSADKQENDPEYCKQFSCLLQTEQGDYA